MLSTPLSVLTEFRQERIHLASFLGIYLTGKTSLATTGHDDKQLLFIYQWLIISPPLQLYCFIKVLTTGSLPLAHAFTVV
jgi:hypothetical protein